MASVQWGDGVWDKFIERSSENLLSQIVRQRGRQILCIFSKLMRLCDIAKAVHNSSFKSLHGILKRLNLLRLGTTGRW